MWLRIQADHAISCRNHHYRLFKMDAGCGQLRDGKQPAFIRLMQECRRHAPDLIVLNHRLNLGEEIVVVLLGMKSGAEMLQPAVWITARELPFTAKPSR
jgi:hypothetical protein